MSRIHARIKTANPTMGQKLGDGCHALPNQEAISYLHVKWDFASPTFMSPNLPEPVSRKYIVRL